MHIFVSYFSLKHLVLIEHKFLIKRNEYIKLIINHNEVLSEDTSS